MSRDGTHDFNFLFGAWKVHNMRLKRPLEDEQEWYTFEGTCIVRPVWGGKANMDEFVFDDPHGRFEGMTMRLYNAESGLWSLYWGTPQRGLVTKPNVGRFDASGRGEFFSEELYEDTPIVCRYRWFSFDEDKCRWEQAFSVDKRQPWETNWTMDFTRV